MIAPMKRVYIALQDKDRLAVLDALRKLGIVHLEPLEGSVDFNGNREWKGNFCKRQIDRKGIPEMEDGNDLGCLFCRRSQWSV